MEAAHEALSAFDGITAALEARGLKHSGNVWRCPAHPDESPSLSITRAEGKVLVNCFASCSAEDVTTALDLPMAALFDEWWERRNGDGLPKTKPSHGYVTLARLAEAKKIPEEALRRLGWKDSTWDGKPAIEIPVYSEDGTMLLATRYRVADGYRQAQGTSTHLYALWALPYARANRTTVYLAEGETDAATLWYSGRTAVGIPGATNWKREYEALFDGVETIVTVFDADEAGDKLRERIAASGLRDRAAAIQLPDGYKDISDVYASDPEGFTDWLIGATALATPLAEVDTLTPKLEDIGLVDLTSIMDGTAEPPKMLEEGWLAENVLTIFHGQGESCKTWAALERAKRQIKQGRNVVWVDFEMGRVATVARLKLLGLTKAEVEKHLAYFEHPALGRDADARKLWTSLIERVKPALVVWDAQTGAFGAAGVEENSGTSVAEWQSWYIDPVLRAGGTPLVIDHEPYDEARPRGTTQKFNSAKVVLAFKTDKNDKPRPDGVGHVKVFCKKNNLAAPIPDFRRVRVEQQDDWLTFGEEDDTGIPTPEEIEEIAEAEKAKLRESAQFFHCRNVIPGYLLAASKPLGKQPIRDRCACNMKFVVEALDSLVNEETSKVTTVLDGTHTKWVHEDVLATLPEAEEVENAAA